MVASEADVEELAGVAQGDLASLTRSWRTRAWVWSGGSPASPGLAFGRLV